MAKRREPPASVAWAKLTWQDDKDRRAWLNFGAWEQPSAFVVGLVWSGPPIWNDALPS